MLQGPKKVLSGPDPNDSSKSTGLNLLAVNKYCSVWLRIEIIENSKNIVSEAYFSLGELHPLWLLLGYY